MKGTESVNLSGKVFLVTGGSSGLGAACVHEFSSAGANVVICDVSERGEALAKELGSGVRFARTDV
ncbi:MAG TPA: SDR family NAD(P)-dependent oxidoreductase, partial [Candidatus Baltobacteraceae bacterium]|nr:SDR family NAD(P)-dependent oxidoreductase [Candidatus Baltobacteraceae bacterium]